MWDWHNINSIIYHLIHQVQIRTERKYWQFHTYESTAAAKKVELLSKTSVYVTISSDSGNLKMIRFGSFHSEFGPHIQLFWDIGKLHCVDMATRLFASIIPVPCLAPWQGQALVKKECIKRLLIENDLNHTDLFDSNHHVITFTTYIQYIAIWKYFSMIL